MRISQKQMESVLLLPAPKRYSHFIKVAADQRKVWGLYSDGWALAATDEGEQVFALWPAQEYAKLCAKGGWVGYDAREIDMDSLLEALIPKLKASGTLVGVFPTPSEKGITPDLSQFESDLRTELSRIE